MSHRVLHAGDAYWRPSNAFKVPNTDLAKQLGSAVFGARLWRLGPGQTSTWHRHVETTELYVVLEGTGRMRIGEERLTLAPLSAVEVDARTLRQVFNDTDADALWLVVGAPLAVAQRAALASRLARAHRPSSSGGSARMPSG